MYKKTYVAKINIYRSVKSIPVERKPKFSQKGQVGISQKSRKSFTAHLRFCNLITEIGKDTDYKITH